MLWALLLDVMLCLFVVGFLVKGYRDGLLKTVVSFVAYLASFIGARIFSGLLGNRVATLFRPGLYEFALEKINQSAVPSSQATVESILDSFPALLSGMLNSSGIQAKIQESIAQAYAKGAPALATVVVDDLLLPVVVVNLQILFFVLFFMLFMMLARRVSRMMRSANHIPVLGPLNRLGGAGIGLLKGALFAVLFTILSGLLIPLTQNGAQIFTDTILMQRVFRWFLY